MTAGNGGRSWGTLVLAYLVGSAVAWGFLQSVRWAGVVELVAALAITIGVGRLVVAGVRHGTGRRG